MGKQIFTVFKKEDGYDLRIGLAGSLKDFMKRFDFNAGKRRFPRGEVPGGQYNTYEELFEYLTFVAGPFHKKMNNIVVLMEDENLNWMYATGREDIKAMNFAYVHEPLSKRIVEIDDSGHLVYDSAIQEYGEDVEY